MSTNIPTAFAEEYGSNVELLVQQRGSMLRRGVRIVTITDAKSRYIEQVGAVVAEEALTRHGDSPQMDTPHQVTRIDPRDFHWGDFVDTFDELKTKISAAGAYTIAASWALGRQMDDLIITASTGNAQRASGGTAATSASAVALPAAQKVAVDFVESGATANSGLTVGKLREARKILREGNVAEDEELFFAVRAQQTHDLLKDDEVTSIDFNTVRTLVDGKVNSFMGFTFLPTQRLTNTSGDLTTCFCWARSGLALGVALDTEAIIERRGDKQFSMYVYYRMSMESARLEDEKVVQVICDESP